MVFMDSDHVSVSGLGQNDRILPVADRLTPPPFIQATILNFPEGIVTSGLCGSATGVEDPPKSNTRSGGRLTGLPPAPVLVPSNVVPPSGVRKNQNEIPNPPVGVPDSAPPKAKAKSPRIAPSPCAPPTVLSNTPAA